MVDVAGGQAVIEGVMMRKGTKVATAVRLPNGKITIKKQKVKIRKSFWKIPFLRGVIALWDMLFIGMGSLIWSSNQQLDDHEKISKKEIFFTVMFSLLFTVLIFVVIPWFVTAIFLDKGFWFNLVDGIIRILFFVVYVAVIGMMKDVKTLFRYHGAEHKTIHCYESKKALTYKNIKPFTTLHPRCGTSFIFIVLAIAIIVFSLVKNPAWYVQIGVRILFLPVIAGIAYEILKYSAKFQNNFIVKALIQPGLWLQRITTKEPNKKQIEVAVAAFKAVQ